MQQKELPPLRNFFATLWLMVSFIPFINWTPLLHIGIRMHTRQWQIWGAVHGVAMLSLFVLVNPSGDENLGPIKEDTALENLYFLAYFAFYILCIVQTLGRRGEYLHYLATGQKQPPKTVVKKPETAPHPFQRELNEATALSEAILKKIKDSSHFDTALAREIKPTVNNYLQQLEEYAQREIKLRAMQFNTAEADIKKKMTGLEEKKQATDNPDLQAGYAKNLQQYAQRLESLKEIKEQRELIALRIEHTLGALKQLKLDLLKLESATPNTQRQEIFSRFDERISELSDYANALDSAYSKMQ